MSNPLPTSVPCLDPTGSNWAIFSMCFEEAMEANQKWGHFTSSTICPVPSDINKPTNEEKEELAAWDQDETDEQDVRMFLGQMHVKCEELTAVGVTMGEKEYHLAIIKALPEEMSKFASGLLTTAHVLSPTTSIDPDTLIDHISEEADRLVARRKCDGGVSGKGKQPQTKDEAMATTQGDAGKKHHKGKCHNCGKPRH
ncbi:hypothetical protein H4582DRAFT_2071907 [Lactarius indigo]|nr:hypothetical protein H4582DRAFT_2071907 [Lactarius indigo]